MGNIEDGRQCASQQSVSLFRVRLLPDLDQLISSLWPAAEFGSSTENAVSLTARQQQQS